MALLPSPSDVKVKPGLIRYVLATALTLLITLAAHVADIWLTLAGLSMLYLAGVVLAATYLGRREALLASALSAAALNFFFTEPRHTFRIANPDNIIELAALLAVSLVISHLVHRLREEVQGSHRREHRLRMINQLSQALERADVEAAIRLGVEHLHLATNRPCALYLPAGTEGVRCAWAEPENGEPGYDSRAVRWVMDHGRALGPYTRNWPELPYWAVPLPGGGALVLSTCTQTTASRRELSDLENFAHLIGLALRREEAQDEARQAHLRAETETLRNTLLASLSHDVRTPLAVILGAAGALRAQDAALSPAQRSALLAQMEDEAQEMSHTAENVLQLARVSASGFAPRLDWESVEETLGAVVSRLRKRQPEAGIHLHLAKGLPLARVDAGLLSQACSNLLENALKYGGDGPVDVTAEVRDGRLMLAVKDRGAGFRNSAAPPDPNCRSSGLGLQVCEAIARVHGGRLELRQRANGGGEARLILPLEATPAIAPEDVP